MEPIIKTEELVSYLEAALSGNNQLIQGATKSIKYESPLIIEQYRRIKLAFHHF